MNAGYDSFPPALVAGPQWVVWRWQQRDGRTTKVPYTAGTERRASSTDPATWSTFEVAVGARPDDGGLGFVLTNGIVFVDLDHVLDEGGQLVPWAAEIVARMGSYSELSPSGDGLHVLVLGHLPGPVWHRREMAGGAHIELYDHARFATMTGQVLVGRGELTENQRAVDWLLTTYAPPSPKVVPLVGSTWPADLSDHEVIEELCRSSWTARLWAGDYGGYASHSEADLALVRFIEMRVGSDPGRIDRLFRMSGLMRRKWERRNDYRTGTIRKVLESPSWSGGS